MSILQPNHVLKSTWRKALTPRPRIELPPAVTAAGKTYQEQQQQQSIRHYSWSSSSSSASSSKAAFADTLIVGGGPVGCSTAYHLAQLQGGDGAEIVVVERDPTYRFASATLSAGGIRQQFSLRENVQMSLYGIEFLRRSQELLNVDVQLQEHGYLFLASCHSPSAAEQMRRNHAVQVECGADIELLSPQQLQMEFPWLNVRDVSLGSYGRSGEGWFDPWAFIQGLKQTCRDRFGVTFVTGSPVSSTRNADTGHVTSVRIASAATDSGSSSADATTMDYSVNHVVNAAGAHCADVLRLLAESGQKLRYPIPVEGRKRCIYFVHCPKAAAANIILPLTVCPTTGVYIRSEGARDKGHFLCGVSPPEDEDPPMTTTATTGSGTTDKDNDHWSAAAADETLFETVIWPALYERFPDYFDELKVKSSWAGLYDYNTFDQNGIIDFHPELPNVLLVNGFSGHGLQHSPASGRAAAELLHSKKADGSASFYRTLNLSIFKLDRVLFTKQPVLELGIV